jgi:hypothetical protein
MSCVCINQLKALAAQLKNLPMNMLMALAADALGPLNTGAAGAMALSAAASASANASAAASASASANLSMNLSASALASIEALAYMNGTLGLGSFNASAAARMNIMATSMNQNLPTFMGVLSAFLSPATDALNQLLALASAMNNIHGLTGVNLGLPGAGLRLGAFASAKASASASASASAAASLSASAMAAMRLNAAARALGINLGAPGGAASLNAALSAALAIRPPSLPIGNLSALLGQMSALSGINKAMGLDMLAKMAMAALMNKLGIVGANLTAAASASASASATASAAASASASANLSAVASAAASLNASVLAGLPNLGPMSMAVNLSAQLQAAIGINPFASTPCGSCHAF